MIKIHNLSKMYNNTPAVDKLNLNIKKGEILGLIGHNGAGKTTTIKSLVSSIKFDSGEIIIDGLNLEDNRDSIKKIISYVPDEADMFLKFTVLSYIRFIAKTYGIDDKTYTENLNKYLDMFEIKHTTNLLLEELSHGTRQKVYIIASIIANPKIWILDEPFNSLDPQASFNLKKIMNEFKENNKSVLISTHLLDIAEKLCDRVAILKKGKLLFLGTIEELKLQNNNKNLEEIYLNMIKE